MKLAVLITSFNRKEKTRACLKGLFKQELPPDSSFQVFLCDKQSTDRTYAMLATEFPEVRIVQGNGKLYWGGGMH